MKKDKVLSFYTIMFAKIYNMTYDAAEEHMLIHSHFSKDAEKYLGGASMRFSQPPGE